MDVREFRSPRALLSSRASGEVAEVLTLKLDPSWTRGWCGIALRSAASLLFNDDSHCTILRKTSHKPSLDDKFFCPTATTQFVSMLLDCGVEFETSFDRSSTVPGLAQDVKLDTMSDVRLPAEFPRIPHYGRFLDLILRHRVADNAKSEHIAANWLPSDLTESSKIQALPGIPAWLASLTAASLNFDPRRPSFRECILYSNLLRSIHGCLRALTDDHRREIKEEILDGAVALIFRIRYLLQQTPVSGLVSASESNVSPVSSFLLMHAAMSYISASAILEDLGYRRINEPGMKSTREWVKSSLSTALESVCHWLMAKRWAGDDVQYDVISLACGMNGWITLKPDARQSAFFRACVQAIVDDQLPSGCWPDGASIVISTGGETIQIPSTEVALCLAKCAFRRDSLVDATEVDVSLMQIAHPALRRHCEYLASSWRAIPSDAGEASGWTSDRTRIWGEVETWVTASAAALFHTTYLIERSLLREATLRKYSAWRPPRSTHSQPAAKTAICEYWDKKFIAPESITKIDKKIRSVFLEPIEAQEKGGRTIIKLQSDGVSLLLYGPPGSGKTFLVKTIARATGWPLIELNPGNFIEKGLELIEAVAGPIFHDLCNLEHAIVFFDECDELFRSRDGNSSETQPRNIATFVTAAMLPKLQKLHDWRRVIFVVATNYLEKIDDAIRRPGRFDLIQLLDRPHSDAREAFIREAFNKKNPSLGDADVAQIVDATKGLTIPEISAVCRDFPKLPNADKLERMTLDYTKWCREHWEDEAKAGGIVDQSITKISVSRGKELKAQELME